MIGLLGGMGPLAGVDLARRIIERTPAVTDQGHIPLMLYSASQIPDRSAAILDGEASPLPELEEGVRVLVRAGARSVAIACNTAHHWYDDLRAAAPVPLLHVCDAVLADLAARGLRTGVIGLIATTGALRSGFYQRALERAGYKFVTPSAIESAEQIMPAIAAIKAGRLAAAAAPLQAASRGLTDRGAQAIILGCSELGLVLRPNGGPFVDSMDALADACIRDAWPPAAGLILGAPRPAFAEGPLLC